MKKVLLVSLMLLLFTVYASGSRESWVSAGGEIGYFIENQSVGGTVVTTTLNSAGAYLKALQFNDGKDVGIMVHDSFLLPLGGTIKVEGESIDYSFSEVDLRSHLGIIIGPVFRKPLGEGKDFYIGAGPSMQQLVVGSSGDAAMSFLFGVGFNTGIKLDIGERTYWDIGITADASVYSYSISSAYPDGTWNDLFNVSLRPHIGFGYILDIQYERR